MSLSSAILNYVAPALQLRRRHEPRRQASDPRILVIRRNRMGDMIYTLPLLHALRRHFPKAHISVACDPLGEPIALACPAVNDVLVLVPSWNPWQAAFKNAVALQDYDWVIAAKGGFDRRLAMLTRLTNAAVRIGFERRVDRPSAYFTDPIALPDEGKLEHQIDTLLRLLKPLGLVKPTGFTVDLSLHLPDFALNFAADRLSHEPFATSRPYMLINLSSTVKLRFREEDFISLAKRVLNFTDLAIGLVAAPHDQQQAREIALCMASKRIVAVETPGPMELAALMQRAVVVLTPEGGAAHLAAAMNRPALVLWSEGPFEKWHSRCEKHAYVHLQGRETIIPIDRVWAALEPFLKPKATGGDEKSLEQMLEPTPDLDAMEDE